MATILWIIAAILVIWGIVTSQAFQRNMKPAVAPADSKSAAVAFRDTARAARWKSYSVPSGPVRMSATCWSKSSPAFSQA